MAKTILEELIVVLGIDPSNYKKGEEEAAKSTEQTAARVTAAQAKTTEQRKRFEQEQQKRTRESAELEKKRADATVKGFKDIALQASALFLGFDSLKGFVTLLGSMNQGEADLGRLSKNIGVNVHELNTWGLAAETLGGKAEDVRGALAGVSKSITDLQVNAQVSPLFLLAQRLGLDIRNVTDKTKFLLDLGDKLRAYAAAHGRDNAFNISGLDASTFNLITADNARAVLADAERRNSVNEASAKAAADSQAKFRTVAQEFRNSVSQIQHDLVPAAADFALGSIHSIQNQAEALSAAVHGDFRGAWQKIRESAGYGQVTTDVAENQRNLAAAEKAYGLKAGSLDAIAFLESNYNAKAVNKSSGATGLMQLMPGTFGADVGKDTRQDIDTAAREFATLLKHYGGDYVLAAEAYNFGRGRLDAFLAGKADPKTGKVLGQLPSETRKYGAQYAQLVAATPGLNRGVARGTIDRSGGDTNVTIGEIVVNTKATDANGVAAGLAGAIKRQTYAAQANTGLTQ